MITISLCMIVKNEEDVLERCLRSAAPCVDEIIIVDTGSTDRTKEIAKGFTDKVYDFTWCDDFAAARNTSFSYASKDYCMWLDADDVLLEKEQKKLLALKKKLGKDVDMVMAKYHTAFDKEGNPTFTYYRERLIRNHTELQWVGAVHEVIPPAGRVIHTDFAVAHKKLHPSDPDRNLRIFEKLLAEGKELDPRQQFYYGRELYYHARYTDAIAVFDAFLNEGKGWVENEIDACQHLSYCHQKLGQVELALGDLFRSFRYDAPRAEICCGIGNWHLTYGQIETAIFWFELALTRKRKDEGGGFISPDCYGYVPHMQLCVCFDRLGDSGRAIAHNEAAGKLKPDDPAYLYNKEYFARKKA